MPYDIRVIQSQEFLRVDAEGHVDFKACRALLADVVWAATHGGIARLLLDVRGGSTDITAAQVCHLADVCHAIAPSEIEHKIAILNRPKDALDRAAILADMVQSAGWNVRAFRDFEEAFNWLAC